MRRLPVLAAAVCLLTLLSGCSGLKVGPGWEGEQVIGEGFVPYDASDLAKTRADALAAAQRNAVEQVVGVFVTGSTMVKEAVAIDQKIMARTQGFVKRYKVTSEAREGDYYRLKIKAVVMLQDLSKALDDMNLTDRGPKAVVFTDETIDGKASDKGGARGGIYRAIKGAYSIVEPDRKFGHGQLDDPSNALDSAKLAGATLVFIVTANAYKLDTVSQAGASFLPYRAQATVKAYSANDGQLITEVSHEASGTDPVAEISAQKALGMAGELAAKDALPSVAEVLHSGTTVVLKVLGMDGLDQLKKFQDMLRGLAGLQNFSLTQYLRGDAFFSVTVRGISAEELTASMLRKKPFSLESQTISQNEIVLKAN